MHGRRGVVPRLVIAHFALLSTSAVAAVMDFESALPQQIFGKPNNDPPDVEVFRENNIAMSLFPFTFRSSSDFFMAQVGGRYASAFLTQSLTIDNITAGFDFSDMPFPVDRVTVDLRDFGVVSSNFSVNGATTYILNPNTMLPTFVAPGVTAQVDKTLLTVTGQSAPILELRIGGQELVIDNVRAVPDPASGLLLIAGALLVLRRR